MKNLRNHIHYYWWTYIVAVVLVFALWLPLFSRLAEPKANEQINITYIGTSFNHLKLQSDLYDILPQRTKQGVKRISVENAVIEGEYDLNTILRARLAGSCDFFIIERSVIEDYEIDLASYFSEVDVTKLEKIFENIDKVTENNKNYGIALNSGMKISTYYSGKDGCVIFFNKNSVNMSDLFGNNTENDACVQVIKYLTEGKDV